MKMKNNIGFLALIVLLQPMLALAEGNKPKDDIFIHFDTGISLSRNLKSMYENNMGSSYIFGVGAKYQLSDRMKVGASVSYRPGYTYNHAFPLEDGTAMNLRQKFKITSLMINTSFDLIEIKDKVKPYVEIGVGISRVNADLFYMNPAHLTTLNGQSTNNLTASGLLGASFKLYEKTNINIGYRYIYFGRMKQPFLEGYKNKGKLAANEFIASLEFKL